MPSRFPPLHNGQRIEVYLEDGKIREGTFCEWMPVEGTSYLIVNQNERIKDGKRISGSWFMNEGLIKLIYPL